MKVTVKFSAYIKEEDVPPILLDEDYLKEVFKENIEDVLLGMDMSEVDIENIYLDLTND
jgi:hypothetical protein